MVLTPEFQVRPHVPPDLIRQLVKDCFHLTLHESAEIKELVSYDDKNFLIRGAFDSSTKDVTYNQFVLKIFNASETALKPWYDKMSNIVIECSEKCLPYFRIPAPVCSGISNSALALYEIPVTEQSVVAPNNLEDIVTETDTLIERDSKLFAEHIVRLTEYIPGRVVDVVNADEDLLLDAGRCCGTMSLILKDAEKPSFDGRLDWRWNVISASKSLIDPYVTKLDCDKKRQMVLKILKDYDEHVAPKLVDLPKQWIHSDFNDQNILHSDNKIVGLIDFDDLCYSYAAVDLAILLMYISAMSPEETRTRNMRLVYEGFVSKQKITDLEYSLLFKLMLVRYAQSCCISYYQYQNFDPTNEYLLLASKKGWKIFEDFVAEGEDEFFKKLKI